MAEHAGEPPASTAPAAVPVPAPSPVPMPRLLDVMWGRDPRGNTRRGPKPGLTLEQIAATGVEIADTEGLNAVSMSQVAKRLGFTTMSLYRYVTSKDELETAMVDQAYGAPFVPWPGAVQPDRPDSDDSTDRGLGWRTRLQAWASALREALLRHPWMLQLIPKEPPLGPNVLGWMEVGLAALAGTPLPSQAKLSSLLLVDVYTRGQTQLALGLTGPGSGDGAILYGRRLWTLTQSGDFPHLRAAVMGGSLDDDGDFSTEEFTFGLRTVLDGIQANIDRES